MIHEVSMIISNSLLLFKLSPIFAEDLKILILENGINDYADNDKIYSALEDVYSSVKNNKVCYRRFCMELVVTIMHAWKILKLNPHASVLKMHEMWGTKTQHLPRIGWSVFMVFFW